MTGFGRGEAGAGELRAEVDVRTLNHRHLDVDVRGDPVPPDLDTAMRKRVAERLARGRCEVNLRLELPRGSPERIRVDEALVRSYIEALRGLSADLGLSGEVGLEVIGQLPWSRVVEIVEPSLTDAHREAVLTALDLALEATVEVRRREGSELAADLSGHLARLRELLGQVEAASADLVASRRDRLRERLQDVLEGVAVDEQRVVQEAALLADRSDIAEEVSRFRAYVDQMEELLGQDEACGKRLDFTLQEALREANTMGSKCRGLDVSSCVIEMRSELERMREQAANVE